MTSLLSVLLWEAIARHHNPIGEHLPGLRHDVPVQGQVDLLPPEVAPLKNTTTWWWVNGADRPLFYFLFSRFGPGNQSSSEIVNSPPGTHSSKNQSEPKIDQWAACLIDEAVLVRGVDRKFCMILGEDDSVPEWNLLQIDATGEILIFIKYAAGTRSELWSEEEIYANKKQSLGRGWVHFFSK